MDLASEEFSGGGLRIEAVTLGQKMLERARLRFERGRYRSITGGKSMATLPGGALRTVMNVIGGDVELYFCTKIWQVIKRSCSPDGDRIGGIERQKPYTRLAGMCDVQSQIEFGKRREPRQIGEQPRRDSLHAKRYDPDPGRSVELIDIEFGRYEVTNGRRGDRPVSEQ